jgi:hypothetical protein
MKMTYQRLWLPRIIYFSTGICKAHPLFMFISFVYYFGIALKAIPSDSPVMIHIRVAGHAVYLTYSES